MIPDRAKADAWDRAVMFAKEGTITAQKFRTALLIEAAKLESNHPPERVQHSSVRKVNQDSDSFVGWECLVCDGPAPSVGHKHCSVAARPTPWRPASPRTMRENDTLPVPAIHGPSCTMEDGRCIGYHCPRCGAPTSSQGHTCPEKP